MRKTVYILINNTCLFREIYVQVWVATGWEYKKADKNVRGLFTRGLVPSERKVVELLLGIARHPRGSWRLSRVSRTRPFLFPIRSRSFEKLRRRAQPSMCMSYLQVSKGSHERIFVLFTWHIDLTEEHAKKVAPGRHGALGVVNKSVRCSWNFRTKLSG